jgi:hypothetical protein
MTALLLSKLTKGDVKPRFFLPFESVPSTLRAL